jgi:hypothetical protein
MLSELWLAKIGATKTGRQPPFRVGPFGWPEIVLVGAGCISVGPCHIEAWLVIKLCLTGRLPLGWRLRATTAPNPFVGFRTKQRP